MITLSFTLEEAQEYARALDRVTDNPFVQDDEDSSPVFTLLGVLESRISEVTDPVEVD
tara:strand:- start:309 stop:482 length:174 start_codon:yes stop_codon:yes gene_type:complete